VEERVVIVVHGVGDPKPGDALTRFVGGLCATDPNITTDGVEAIELRQDASKRVPPDDGQVPLYPVHRRKIRLSGSQPRNIALHEVYWGDLSRVKGTLTGVVGGAVDLVFGLRYLVFAAQREAKAPVVSAASSAALYFMRGPVLALNIFGLMVALLFLGFAELDEIQGASASTPGAHLDCLIQASASVGAFLTLVLGIILYRTAKRNGWSTTTAEFMVVVGVGFLIRAPTWTSPLAFEQFVGDFGWVVSIASGLLCLAVVLTLVSAAVKDFAAGRPGAVPPADHIRRPLDVLTACTVLSCALFVFLAMVAWAYVASKIPMASAAVSNRISSGLHLFSLVWFSLLIIGFIYAVLMVRGKALKTAWRVGATQNFPRLLVHPGVVLALCVSGLTWALVFLPTPLSRLFSWTPLADLDKGLSELNNLNSVLVLLSAALVTALLAARTHITTALDLVLDVISHFKDENVPSATQLKRASRAARTKLERKAAPSKVGAPLDAKWTPLWSQETPQWNAMVLRFKDVLESAVATSDAKDILVVAHSQGTMLALEALGVIEIKHTGRQSTARRVSPATVAGRSVRLITMGCPLSHLYMHYFPGKYSINVQHKTLVSMWKNVHRTDDFVGREVDSGMPGFPLNIPVFPRGHINYWTDADVLAVVTPAVAQ
jgi:hypothetical protein